MLLAIDVGNSNTVLGLYRSITPESAGEPAGPRFSPDLLATWRITTPESRTLDEFGVLLRSLFTLTDISASEITGIAISSVVPPIDATLRQVCERFFKLRPLFIEPGVKTGLPVLIDNPGEAGADRIWTL